MKKKIVIIALFAALLFTFGCCRKSEVGARGYDSREFYSWEGAGYNPEGPTLYGRMSAEQGAPVAQAASRSSSSDRTDSISADLTNAERKLVKSADVRIRAENLETADAFVAELMKKYDAYSASTNIEENSRSYFLRVPAPVYELFLAEMDGMGRLLRRSESTEDVTLRYYDLEGRLATKKELLKTYQSYLGRAKNIEEILSVEARIADLQSDIEGTGVQLRNLANRIDYATINLHLSGPASSEPNRGDTFGERVREMFRNFGYFLSGLFFVIIGLVIYGIPILLLVALLFLLLFGRIGLVKKLWQIAKGKKQLN